MQAVPDPRSLAHPSEAVAQTRRGNRRRLAVFIVTFAVAATAGMAWNLSRDSVYRARMKVQVEVPDQVNLGQNSMVGTANRAQWLTSPAVIGRAQQQLASAPGGSHPNAVALAGSMLTAAVLPGSEVIEVVATGTDPELLTRLLNQIPTSARAELASQQGRDADSRLDAARQELARLDKTAQERRARLDAFRQRAGVVAEREDNEAVSRTRSINQALTVATEKEAAAAARLKAFRETVAEGQPLAGLRADPAVSSLEAKAGAVREELREMERSFTPRFMELDPKARSLRTRLAELERQIVQQRQAAQSQALRQATEDHQAAQAQVERLRSKLAEARPALGRTSQRLAEARVLEDDLAQVDKARRELIERVSRLEANESRRVAQVVVVEPAVQPTVPVSPDKLRDGLVVLAGSFALGLAVMTTVESFNRAAAPPPAPAVNTLVIPAAWQPGESGLLPGAGPSPRLGGAARAEHPLALSPGRAPAYAAAPMRVLTEPEVRQLLEAAGPASRLVCTLGLMALAVDEARALTRGDVHGAHLQVPGPAPRELPLPAGWDSLVGDGDPATPLLAGSDGRAWEPERLHSAVLAAALDAGLDDPTAVSFDTLRHTAIAALLAQGARFSDLPRWAGPLAPALLQGLAQGAHGTVRHAPLAPDDVQALHPALRPHA